MQASTCPEAISPLSAQTRGKDAYLWSRTCWARRPDSEQVLLHFLLQERTKPLPAEALGQSWVNPICQTMSLLKPGCVGQGSRLNLFFFNGNKIHLT